MVKISQMPMNWLMKSEPGSFSIEDLKKSKSTHWDGVRNYQARNYMRDQMKVGDRVLFYHSNANPSGIVGIAKITKTGIVDTTAFDPKSKYYDPKSTRESPRWIMVEVTFVKQFPQIISLEELRKAKELQGMKLLQKGSRLSITPVTDKEFSFIEALSSRICG